MKSRRHPICMHRRLPHWKAGLLSILVWRDVLLLLAGVAFAAATSHAPAVAVPSGGECRMRAGTFETLTVPSQMGPIEVQVQWARHCGARALYLLDGLRARLDTNGWSDQTAARALFAEDNITLVMPAGGPGSWYADWSAPTVENGRTVTYRWETFLTQELPAYLASYGVSPTGNGIVGLSMSASSALTLTAGHRDQFISAAAFSGLLDWHTPDLREAVRTITWQAGHNPDSLAAPGHPRWNDLDPYLNAPQLAGVALYIASGPGLPFPGEFDSLSSVPTAVGAMSLEAGTALATRQFKTRLDSLGITATYSFPAAGAHTWRNWDAELTRARPVLLDALLGPDPTGRP
ncbi:alpha/beta hydrolase [Nocardia suismassiliense]|uniref:alpha/beta hydrolase n=1 Tax=Nocardia suismassiliense TaxID=2077092 RepID=UPI001F1C2102|nr:alpha/beta hydrolase family protein [Nocardia suismassiliense]